MVHQEQLDKLKQGGDVWNEWRKQHVERGSDLSNADLSGINLSDADLSGVNLSNANLSGANLIDANLSGANLSNANLSDANLSNANLLRADLIHINLSNANISNARIGSVNLSSANLINANLNFTYLRSANLSDANLSDANLSSAGLSGANLSNAIVRWTVFGNIDLRTVINLETITHLGPSDISTSTLELSRGEIPHLFLKGAGLSDTFITYVRSLIQSPIDYYTCFISYSSKDELFAKRLHNDLQQEGVRCWFAPENMDIGDKIKYRIDESIRIYDKLLLILSEHSLTSNWVAYEVKRALNKEPKGIPNVLYPIRVDQTILNCTTDWARKIKENRLIGDFEHWVDPLQYEVSFNRLLRALDQKKKS